jgi:hypothetical protein
MVRIQLINRFPLQVFPTFLLISVILCFSPAAIDAKSSYRKLINCALHDGACVQRVGDTDITLEVTPKPVLAMNDLVFSVTLSRKVESPKSLPYIDLGMPGMDMGPNRVKMKPLGKNVFEGKGVIVKCPSGHRVWRATVTVPDMGKAEYIFDVIY